MNVQRCGAKTRSGAPCAKTAGWGTSHNGFGNCKLHGGASPNGEKHGKRLEAEQAVVTYGLPREVDPHSALLEELHRTAGHVAWLGQLVGDLNQRDLKQYQLAESGGVIERPAIWVELYHRERAHFAKVAKTCVDVGIEERRVKLAEQQGELLAQVIRGVLTDLGVADHPEAPAVVRRHLTLVA
jgi:hypothetical protein